MVTSALVSAASNLSAQQIRGSKRVDVRSVAVMSAYGVSVGAILHFWFRVSNQLLGSLSGNTRLFVRLLLNELFFQPALCAWFFCFTTALQQGPQHVVPRLRAAWLLTVLRGLRFWPLVNFVNFKYVPGPLQVFYGNLMAFAWNIYLSLKLRK
jgi:hypothetical protein